MVIVKCYLFVTPTESDCSYDMLFIKLVDFNVVTVKWAYRFQRRLDPADAIQSDNFVFVHLIF